MIVEFLVEYFDFSLDLFINVWSEVMNLSSIYNLLESLK
jgi:hypothetical protein